MYLVPTHSGIQSSPIVMNERNRQFDRPLLIAFNYLDKITPELVSSLTGAIRKCYFGDKSISTETGKVLQEVSWAYFFFVVLAVLRMYPLGPNNNKLLITFQSFL